MKLFIILALMCSSVFANECHELFEVAETDFIMLQDLEEIEEINFSDGSGPLFSESRFLESEVISFVGDFEADRCENALTGDEVSFNGKSLNFIYTMEDECDGGNSYGYIENQDGKLVGFIGDSEIYCIER